ncbi:MAG: extracellular solute-binding protein [bacterium]
MVCATSVSLAPEKIGGEVLLYSCTLSKEPWDTLVAMVKDKLGADLKCLDMGSGEMISRVTAEAGNPQADVNFGNDDTVHKALAKRGLLEPYKGPGRQSLPANLKDPDGYWVGLYMGVIGFAYHPERLKELGVEPPTSWQDLLNPKLKGEVVLASPATSGTAYTVLYSIVSLYGEEKGFQFMKDPDKNILPVLPGVKVPPGNYTLEDVKILPLDREKMGSERARLIKRWEDGIGLKR